MQKTFGNSFCTRVIHLSTALASAAGLASLKYPSVWTVTAVVSPGWTCVRASASAPLTLVRQVARMLRMPATWGLLGSSTSDTGVRAKWTV